jgi:hypothetical protein
MSLNIISGNGRIFGNGQILFLSAPTYGAFLGVSRPYTDLSYTIIPPTSTSSAPFTYSSSNPNFTISGNRILFSLSGSTVITASQAALGTYVAGSKTGTFTAT